MEPGIGSGQQGVGTPVGPVLNLRSRAPRREAAAPDKPKTRHSEAAPEPRKGRSAERADEARVRSRTRRTRSSGRMHREEPKPPRTKTTTTAKIQSSRED